MAAVVSVNKLNSALWRQSSGVVPALTSSPRGLARLGIINKTFPDALSLLFNSSSYVLKQSMDVVRRAP